MVAKHFPKEGDGASIQTANNIIRLQIKYNLMKDLSWKAKSHDLNIIENVEHFESDNA